METITIRTVNPIEAVVNFERYQQHIAEALEHDYMHDTMLEDAKDALMFNHWHLHEISQDGELLAVFCTEIHGRRYNPGILNVVVLGGHKLNEWLDDVVSYLVMVAEGLGCNAITCYGRKGWARALKSNNFKPVSQVMLKEV
jgi:hypothetical protein